MNPLIDLDYAVTLLGGDKSLALEILADFKREIPKYLSDMAVQLAQQDYSQLVSTIHKVGGGASYAGAKPIRELAKKIELAYKNDNHFLEKDYDVLIESLQSITQIDMDEFL